MTTFQVTPINKPNQRGWQWALMVAAADRIEALVIADSVLQPEHHDLEAKEIIAVEYPKASP